MGCPAQEWRRQKNTCKHQQLGGFFLLCQELQKTSRSSVVNQNATDAGNGLYQGGKIDERRDSMRKMIPLRSFAQLKCLYRIFRYGQ